MLGTGAAAFGEYSNYVLAVNSLSDSLSIVFDKTLVEKGKPIVKLVSDRSFRSNVTVKDERLEISTDIHSAADALYPKIIDHSRFIYWLLQSDGSGTYSLFIADNEKDINEIGELQRKEYKAQGMESNQIKVQSYEERGVGVIDRLQPEGHGKPEPDKSKVGQRISAIATKMFF
jgi:hypothetical protein